MCPAPSRRRRSERLSTPCRRRACSGSLIWSPVPWKIRTGPAVYPFGYYAPDGGLICYGANTVDMWWRAASYVDRILRGAKPADLPVQNPTRYDLIINLKTAKALGIEIPPALLTRADEVIE